MFEKYFNRPYETHDFPYFLHEKELYYNRKNTVFGRIL